MYVKVAPICSLFSTFLISIVAPSLPELESIMRRNFALAMMMCGLILTAIPAHARRPLFPDIRPVPNADRENVELIHVEPMKINGQDCKAFYFVVNDTMRYVYAYKQHCVEDKNIMDHGFTMSHLTLNRGARDFYVFFNSKGTRPERWIYKASKHRRR